MIAPPALAPTLLAARDAGRKLLVPYITGGYPGWQDAIRAWKEYQATGLHATREEADAWLARLEAGEDVEPPECHA